MAKHPLLDETSLADTLELYMPASFEDGTPSVDLVAVLDKLTDLTGDQMDAVCDLVIGAYHAGQDSARKGRVVDAPEGD